MIADPDFDPALDQRLRDVGLDIGEADAEIRLQLENAIDLGAGGRRDPGLSPARTPRAYREAGDAHDAPALPERVQNLRGFFGQANDAARISTVHACAQTGT